MYSEAADFALKKLNSYGYDAYIVGGAVRDVIMKKVPSDIDITTSALPNEIKEVFKEERIIETGIKHGTVTLIKNGEPVEITTFRTEDGYSDGRHPDRVIFTKDIRDDLSRRDFTINSIAFNEKCGYEDPFNGIGDISLGIIRCVGNPESRFREDSLRILRALRFSSVLGFEIEKKTHDAIFECKELLKNISVERIFDELMKLLCGKNVKSVIMNYAEVLSVCIPQTKYMIGFDQHNFHHKYDLLEHTATVTEAIRPEVHLRLAAFLHDIAKPHCLSFDESGTGHFYGHASLGAAMAEDILTSLRCDNRTKSKVVMLIKQHDTPIEESERIVKRRLHSIGRDLFFELIELKQADTKGLADEFHSRSTHFEELKKIAEKILEQELCFSLKDLAVNGNDMLKYGFKGKEIGEMLQYLLEAVIDEKVPNEKEKLTEFINKKTM